MTRPQRDARTSRATGDATSGRISLRDLMETHGPPRWLIEGFLPENGRALLVGHGGEGKSWIALEAARTVAEGQPFLGRFQVPEGPARVFYIDKDGGSRMVAHRMRLLGADPEKLDDYWASTDTLPPLNTRAGLEALRRHLTEWQPRLVVLDSWSNLVSHGFNENRAKDTMGAIEGLKQLQADHPFALLIIHHANKRDARTTDRVVRIRGSSALVAQTDVAYMIQSQRRKADETGRAIGVIPLARKHDEGRPFLVGLDQLLQGGTGEELVRLSYLGEFDPDADPEEASLFESVFGVIVDFGAAGATIDAIAEKLGGLHSKKAIRRATSEMTASGRIRRVSEAHNRGRFFAPEYRGTHPPPRHKLSPSQSRSMASELAHRESGPRPAAGHPGAGVGGKGGDVSRITPKWA